MKHAIIAASLICGLPSAASAADLPICQQFLASYQKDLQIAGASIDAVSSAPAPNMSAMDIAQKLAVGEHAILLYSMASSSLAYAKAYDCSLDPFAAAEAAFRARYEN